MPTVEPVRPIPRRLDTAGPGTADAVGLRLTFGALVRWSPVVAVAVLLGWVAGTSLPQIGQPASAHVTVGLTDDVRWPFYDAVMARQPALLGDPAVRSAAEDEVGVAAHDVVADLDTGQTGAVLRIVVEADTEDDALALADGLGERLVAANLAEQRAVIDERVTRLTAEVERRRTELQELDARRDRERLALDVDAAEITQAQLLVVASDLTEAESQLEAALEELTTLGPRVEVLAPAVAGRNRDDDVRTSAVTAALLGMLALAAVPTLERRFGRVRSLAQLRRVWPGVAGLDERRGSAVLGDDLHAALDALAVAHGSLVVLTGDAVVAERLHDRAGITGVLLGDPDTATTLAAADGVVVAIRRKTVPLRRLDEIADGLAGLGIRPAAVILAS